MSIIYNIILALIKMIAKGASHLPGGSKMLRFTRGQRRINTRIRRHIKKHPITTHPVVWVHCASMGEYAIARPIIRQIHRQRDCTVVLTFFSPTGYEALSIDHPDVDHVFYLPLDTRRNVRRFLKVIDPQVAVFTVSEYWYNYLRALERRRIPTFLVSARVHEGSIFYHRYGMLHRRCLRRYDTVFVLDDDSRSRLRQLGCRNVVKTADPLLDNAISRASTPWHDERIDSFIADTPRSDIFIAGSVHDDRDIEIVAAAVSANPTMKHIIVPHEVSRRFIDRIISAIGPATAVTLYSAARGEAASSSNVLIVDTVGILAYIYRYGSYAYVGGGFTPLIHSVIEPAVYGIPVAFGPRIERQHNPHRLLAMGQGTVVNTPGELCAWISHMTADAATREEIGIRAKEAFNVANGTEMIVGRILKSIGEHEA